jgi:hypothetical protein
LPQPQKKIDIVIPLPKELQDMGYKELHVKDQNGIVVTEDDTRFLFTFDERNYSKSLERLKAALIDRKIDDRIATVVCVRLSNFMAGPEFNKILAARTLGAAAAKSTTIEETKFIIDDIKILLEKYGDIPYQVWYEELQKRYQNLRQAVKDNVPEAWDSLECVLTAKGILHIKDITLPLVLVLIGNPSTWKTVGISMLRRWPNTFYTDEFNPASLVSHANVDETKIDLESVDMIRDMKDRLTMLPELSPLFMKHEEKLGETLSKLTRLPDGEGLKTHSGLHGLRGVDEDLMFSIIGATVQVPNRVYKVLSSLGPKLYFFRTAFIQTTKQQLKENIKGADFKLKTRNIKETLFSYLKWLEVCPLMENLASMPEHAYVRENPIPTEKEMRKGIDNWFVWPHEYCNEYTDANGIVHRKLKPEYNPKSNPEATEKAINEVLKREVDAARYLWKEPAKLEIIHNLQGILYEDKFSDIYDKHGMKRRAVGRHFLHFKSFRREIKNPAKVAAVKTMNIEQRFNEGIFEVGENSYKRMDTVPVYRKPKPAPNPSKAFNWVEYLVNKELNKLAARK